MSQSLFTLCPSEYGNYSIICHLCNKRLVIFRSDENQLYLALEHISEHSNCDLHVVVESAGLMLKYGNPCRVGFKYVAKIIPQLCMVSFSDIELFLTEISNVLHDCPEVFKYDPGNWVDRHGGLLNLVFASRSMPDYFENLIKKVIYNSTYKCGICGMYYDCGLPSIEIASLHLAVCFPLHLSI